VAEDCKILDALSEAGRWSVELHATVAEITVTKEEEMCQDHRR
jgi:hypothetical protein